MVPSSLFYLEADQQIQEGSICFNGLVQLVCFALKEVMNYPKLRMYLVEKRQALNYSQYKVCILSGIPHQHYNRIENGVIGKGITFKTIVLIAKALEISAEDLIKLELKYQAELDKKTA